MRRSVNYRRYVESAEWKERSARFFALRFKGAPYCENCNRHFVPLQGHHATYERLGCEWPQDILFVCKDCHPILDRDRVRRDRQLTERRRGAKRRLEIQRFKRPFKLMARRRGGHNPSHVHWYYTRFLLAWRTCCESSCDRPSLENQRWFLRIHRLMTRKYGRFWFAHNSFEDAVNAYLAFLEEREQPGRR